MNGHANIERPAILVTGGAGYIGSQTCKALASAGYLPITLDNLSLGHRWAVQFGPLEIVDLLDTAGVANLLKSYGVKGVIHFAGSAYVGESMRNPAFYYRNNLLTTLSLLDAMRLVEVRTLVFSSSCSVYGNPERIPVTECSELRPLSPYGQSKLDCENAIRWYARAYGLRWIALRYFNAAGADFDGLLGECHEPETRLVPLAINAALGRSSPLRVFGNDYPTPDGTAIRDYVHVADLASAHVDALRALAEGVESQALNLGTGRGSSVLQVAEAVAECAGTPVPMIFAERRDGDPPVVVADPTRAASVLGWRAQRSGITDIVRTAVRWHASQASFSGRARID
jgi:UDP-glucose-4-epimerase GalE